MEAQEVSSPDAPARDDLQLLPSLALPSPARRVNCCSARVVPPAPAPYHKHHVRRVAASTRPPPVLTSGLVWPYRVEIVHGNVPNLPAVRDTAPSSPPAP